MNFITHYRLLFAITLLPILTGCITGPNYQRPNLETSLKDNWIVSQNPKAIEMFNLGATTRVWWNQYQDPYLNTLVEELVSSNLTLAQARERVVEARSRRGIANASRLPQVDIESDYTRAETGNDSFTFQGPPPGQAADIYRLGAVAGWEVDFWGRVKRLVEAEDRTIEAEREALNSIAVSLVSELTLAYIDARVLEARISLAEKNIELYEKNVALAQAREVAGIGTRLDLERAQKQLQQVQSIKPDLQRQFDVTLNAIDALLGKAPQGKKLPIGVIPHVPALLGLGVPADLIARRADIREAERRYASAVARVGASMADKYPRISLSGSFFLQSDNAGGVFDPDALFYSFGPKVQIPLFSGGRINSQIDVSESQAEQALLNLKQTLIVAVKEVENTAAGVVRSQESLKNLENALGSAFENKKMAQKLYDAGIESMGQLIAAQIELVNSQNDLLIARQNALNQTVLLYRSLGGGWEVIDMNGNRVSASAYTK